MGFFINHQLGNNMTDKEKVFITHTSLARLSRVSSQVIKKWLDRNKEVYNASRGMDEEAVYSCVRYYADRLGAKNKQVAALHVWLSLPDNSINNIFEFSTTLKKPTKAKKSQKGFVYLIKCNEWYKIGKAGDVASRLTALQTASPYQLELVHFIPAKNNSSAEKYLHTLYKRQRGLGEWFKLSKMDVKEIKAMTKL